MRGQLACSVCDRNVTADREFSAAASDTDKLLQGGISVQGGRALGLRIFNCAAREVARARVRFGVVR
jgi:hypothetical protein